MFNSISLKKSTLLAIFMALLLCSLQFGGYSVVSMSFGLFVITAVVIGPRRYLAVVPTVFLAFLLMLCGYIWYVNDTDVAPALFRTLRELVVLATILAACRFPMRWTMWREITVKKTVVLFIALCILFAAIQFLMLEFRGTGPFLPWQLYGPTGGSGDGGTTVPSYWLQFASEYGLEVGSGKEVRIRPVAFYSEPSYLGFMLTAACFCYVKIESNMRKQMLCFGMCMLGALIARTAAGAFSLAAIFVYLNYRNIRAQKMLPYLLIGVVVAITVVFSFADRISGAFDASDASSYSRMVMPLLAFREVISSGRLFGVPSFYVPGFLGFRAGLDLTGAYGGDNGLINLFIFYGLGALILMSAIFSAMRGNWILFVLCALFNGSILHFDKGFVIAAVLLVVTSKASYDALHTNQAVQ